jgi:hypothetical protein
LQISNAGRFAFFSHYADAVSPSVKPASAARHR